MKYVLVIFMMLVFPYQSEAGVRQDLCPDKTLDTEIFTGIYKGLEGDAYLHAVFELKDGDFLTVAYWAGEDKVESYFGPVGSLVIAEYNVEQWFGGDGDVCIRSEVFTEKNKAEVVKTSVNTNDWMQIFMNSLFLCPFSDGFNPPLELGVTVNDFYSMVKESVKHAELSGKKSRDDYYVLVIKTTNPMTNATQIEELGFTIDGNKAVFSDYAVDGIIVTTQAFAQISEELGKKMMQEYTKKQKQ